MVIVGAVTLLFGAIVGCAKDDIKKALAASTMSQIGYMVLAAGLGPAGYAFAIMHLLTHGFFKAGLFLGAGSVMHAMNDEVNMRRYGGLRTVLPITFATFGLGYLAIIGVPPLAGFFSKDGIIEAALGAGGAKGIILGGAAILGAGITAFYMTRVMLMTFFGEKRWAESAHPHESPKVMTWPMILLAVGSVASGGFFAIGGTLEHWLEPVVGAHEAEHATPAWVVTLVVLAVVAVGNRDRVPHVRHASRPRRGAGRVRTHRGGAPGSLRRRIQRAGVHAARAAPHRWSRRDRRRRGGRGRERAGRARRPSLERIPAAANRFRPLVCPVDVGRSGPAGRRDPGGAAMVTSFPWLTVLWAIPMVGAALVMLLPASQRAVAKWLALLISIAVLGVTLVVAVGFKPGGDQYQFVESHTWIPSFGTGYILGVDGIALALVVLTAVLVPLLIIAGWNDASDQIGWAGRSVHTYFALTLAVEGMVLMSLVSLDVLLFYVFFEAMLIPMYFLIGGFGENRLLHPGRR